jgi:hypothetical protein
MNGVKPLLLPLLMAIRAATTLVHNFKSQIYLITFLPLRLASMERVCSMAMNDPLICFKHTGI